MLDSAHSDTTVISREEFHEAAKEFLDIPDLSIQKIAKKYTEETAQYDPTLNRVAISYTAKKPKEEYKSQELLVIPGNGMGDKVTSIIVIAEKTEDGVTTRKNLLWQMDKSFQIATTTQKAGEPEQTLTTKVVWNEENEQ